MPVVALSALSPNVRIGDVVGGRLVVGDAEAAAMQAAATRAALRRRGSATSPVLAGLAVVGVLALGYAVWKGWR